MIQHPAFVVDPWLLQETALQLDRLAETESLFALSNGHLGLRGDLDEGEPNGIGGTYLNGFYETRQMPYAEAGYGFPETDQTMISVANGKRLRLFVNGELFDVRSGELTVHTRILDFRAGTLTRTVEWTSPAGNTVRISSVRLVSLTRRAVAAISYRVDAVNGPIDAMIHSELGADEQAPVRQADPRSAWVFEDPLDRECAHCKDAAAVLVHRTRRSALRAASAMNHTIEGSRGVRVTEQLLGAIARVTVADSMAAGGSLWVRKFVAYGWSADRTADQMRDEVAAEVNTAQKLGWRRLNEDQRRYLGMFWARADVEVEGDAELQQAVRFALFEVLQAGARIECCAIPAKGLTGPGYDGHSFWDTETFVLPVLINSIPEVAAEAIRWRHATLPTAKRHAAELGLAGAAFPWRSINGEECSGYWPAGTAAFHVNADIADAVLRYVNATGDTTFEREIGLEILIETARIWLSLGHFDRYGSFRIDGVTGPDEYSAIADNNLYTNLMAQRNLRAAALGCERHPDRAEALDVTLAECEAWRKAADRVFIPYNAKLGVHEQAEGFTTHEFWNFVGTRSDQYPLMLHFPYFDLYRQQVVKQPDLVLAMQLCGDAFTVEEKARNFAYYERITVRDSSLAASTQAVLAAETGHIQLALAYTLESALIDLDDLEHNVRDGLHLASLAGTWTAMVVGFGGMRDNTETLSFAPRLPQGLARLTFAIVRYGMPLRIVIDARSARYSLLWEHGRLDIFHYGERLILRGTESVERAIPPPIARKPVGQPPGREPFDEIKRNALRVRRELAPGRPEQPNR